MVVSHAGQPSRRLIRPPGYDYASAGAYFVTVCTAGRRCLFGEVRDQEVRLAALGRVVVGEWLASAELRTGVELDRFVVMPNHLHAIVWLGGGTNAMPAGDRPVAPTERGLARGSLGALIANFKAAVTRVGRSLTGTADLAVWQRNYYEWIVRNEAELLGFREYITDNPARWSEDAENPAHVR
jgi:putative transposase